MRWALFHRPKDAWIALVGFVRFLFKFRFHENTDQRIPFLRVFKILKGTCYSCDMINHASSFLNQSSGKTLILGHTHRALRHVTQNEKVYINTGTWNPVLMLKNNQFTSHQHRTFAFYDYHKSRARLLEWLDEFQEVEDFQHYPYNIHMHPNMIVAIKRAMITAMIVWPILIAINYPYEILFEKHFGVFMSTSSLLTFLVPFIVSLASRLTEKK